MFEVIYIPTMGRSDNQLTYNRFPKTYQKKVIFAIPEKDRDEYDYDDNQLLLVPNEIKGIAGTREYICRHAGKIRFSMIDDDVVFYRRNQKYFLDFDKVSNMEKSKRIAGKKDLDEMYNLFDEWMDVDDKLIHIGNRRSNYPPSLKSYTDIIFFNSMHHINGELLSEIIDDIDWTFCKVGEDAHMMIEYLLRGYRNRRTDEFPALWGSYQEGGCAMYRDSKLHNEEHEKLQKKYPEFVKMKKVMMAQGKDGKNIGEIKEFGYNMKRAYKKSQENKK